MRKFGAIFFLVTFLLYNTGHLAYLYLGPMQIAQHWYQEVIDINDKRLKTLRIPIELPAYAVAQHTYQYTDGIIEKNGITYRKVYQRIAYDTMYVKVLPDHLYTDFQNSISDWIDTVNDNTTHQGNERTAPPSIKEFFVEKILAFTFINHQEIRTKTGHAYDLKSTFQQVPTPPPRA